MHERLLAPDVTCWRKSRADRFALVVDAGPYYAALADAIDRAERQILVLAWDFDTRTPLRRDDASGRHARLVDVLVAATGVPLQATELSTYPAAHTDVALVVAEEVPAARVEGALRSGAGDRLESVQLFDIYRGEQVGDGHKSLAYRLTFRAAERTLTTDEVSALRDAAVAAAAERTGAVQR